jgi:hypothetical protein
VGNLTVNRAVCQALVATGEFEWMSTEVDAAEHSIEMQLPFLAHVLRGRERSVTLVPIMVGGLSSAAEARYGALLAPFLHNDPTTFFVLSSDFCHYGSRFDFTPYQPSAGAVWQYIEQMDHQGVEAIATLDPSVFAAYLNQCHNTICGRHPIAVFLHVCTLPSPPSALRSPRVHFDMNVLSIQSSSCFSYLLFPTVSVAGWAHRCFTPKNRLTISPFDYFIMRNRISARIPHKTVQSAMLLQ